MPYYEALAPGSNIGVMELGTDDEVMLIERYGTTLDRREGCWNIEMLSSARNNHTLDALPFRSQSPALHLLNRGTLCFGRKELHWVLRQGVEIEGKMAKRLNPLEMDHGAGLLWEWNLASGHSQSKNCRWGPKPNIVVRWILSLRHSLKVHAPGNGIWTDVGGFSAESGGGTWPGLRGYEEIPRAFATGSLLFWIALLEFNKGDLLTLLHTTSTFVKLRLGVQESPRT
ncbi:hypothetical protein B0H16DRAFT_1455156 [Mycena metata]|uniref:Uncharacterized protein n=1 Tax=Mycena metata TaxID=1033252 RepID=A0AAD7NJ38_9AGAR|nr:hypothetical protein B0H16DRAFT_1455156 [Mycena metata]